MGLEIISNKRTQGAQTSAKATPTSSQRLTGDTFKKRESEINLTLLTNENVKIEPDRSEELSKQNTGKIDPGSLSGTVLSSKST